LAKIWALDSVDTQEPMVVEPVRSVRGMDRHFFAELADRLAAVAAFLRMRQRSWAVGGSRRSSHK
jgi:hypothetical protein